MSSSQTEASTPGGRRVSVTDEQLIVELIDGRTVSIPVSWYPRLAHGQPHERSDWVLIGDGEGIHWPLLDEDIRVADVVAGRASNESEESIAKWLRSRQAG